MAEVEKRDCPYCTGVAELTDEKKIERDTLKRGFTCGKCGRRHLVVVHTRYLLGQVDIERLDKIEEMLEAGKTKKEIGDELGVTATRVNQLIEGL